MDEPVERPETFEPFEKWKAAWKPAPNYVTLTEAAKRISEAGKVLSEVLARCECIGDTMHKVVQLPTDCWQKNDWQYDIEQNSCGQPIYAEHLQFQVSVYEEDLTAALAGKPTGFEEGDSQPPGPLPPRAALEVEDAGVPGLPEGWVITTVEGAAWQAVRPQSEPPMYAPMRVEVARSVSDAWSYSVKKVWS